LKSFKTFLTENYSKEELEDIVNAYKDEIDNNRQSSSSVKLRQQIKFHTHSAELAKLNGNHAEAEQHENLLKNLKQFHRTSAIDNMPTV